MPTLKEFFVTDVADPSHDCSACPRLVAGERLKALNGYAEYALRQVFWVQCSEIKRDFTCARTGQQCAVRQMKGDVGDVKVDVRVQNPQHSR